MSEIKTDSAAYSLFMAMPCSLKEVISIQSSQSEADDLLVRCQLVASRTPTNNALGRSNGHNHSLLGSRTSTYNMIQPLLSQILDESSPSLSVTRRICSGVNLIDSNAFLAEVPQLKPDQSLISEFKQYIKTESDKTKTAIHISPLAAEDLTIAELNPPFDSPIFRKSAQQQNKVLRESSSLIKTKHSTLEISSLHKEQKTKEIVIAPAIKCCSNNVESAKSASQRSPTSMVRSTISSPETLVEKSENNSRALLHALQLTVCQHHAAILKMKISLQGYYLLILDSAFNLLGLAQKQPSGALVQTHGSLPDLLTSSKSARGKVLSERAFKAYLILQGNTLYVEHAPIHYTDVTVGLIV